MSGTARGLPYLAALAAVVIGPAAEVAHAAAPEAVRVYIGTYTGAKSKGIYEMRLDLATGALSEPELAGEVANPSFLAIHPTNKFVYAVSEAGGKDATVSAFAVAPDTGKLTFLNKRSTRGGGPCYVSVDKMGKAALAANYGSGSVCAMPIAANGEVGEATAFIQHAGSGPNAARQKGPHAHCINLTPDNRFALVCDLGLDKVFVYRFDAEKASLAPNDPPSASVAPGAGPRHVAFHPGGKFVYVINEMASTVTAFAYDGARGVLSEFQSVPTLPADFSGRSTTAEIEVHPSGRFLYGSNRGHDSIAVFAVVDDGRLKPLGHQPTLGKTPRCFGIDPSGAWLVAANQGSDNVVVFKIDAATGNLKPAGAPASVGSPVCVKFMPLP
jgi:6-phosphogluconolactonase